jgi:hypothetical protein
MLQKWLNFGILSRQHYNSGDKIERGARLDDDGANDDSSRHAVARLLKKYRCNSAWFEPSIFEN